MQMSVKRMNIGIGVMPDIVLRTPPDVTAADAIERASHTPIDSLLARGAVRYASMHIRCHQGRYR
jgi:hypothetical protein